MDRLTDLLAKSPSLAEVIVVDDGSTDGTENVLKGVAAPGVRVLRHHRNIGYGASLLTGIRAAKTGVIAITDADETYPTERLPEFFVKMQEEQWDMVVGARTGKHVSIPWLRRPAKWILRKLANMLVGVHIPDLNSGLRVIRRDAVLRFARLLPEGFSFTTTITLAMMTNHYAVTFVPIDYKHRKGHSKIQPIHDTLNFVQLILRTVLYFAPLKLFICACLFFMGVSFAMLCFRLFVAKAFGVTSVLFFVCGIQLLAIGLIADMIDKRIELYKGPDHEN